MTRFRVMVESKDGSTYNGAVWVPRQRWNTMRICATRAEAEQAAAEFRAHGSFERVTIQETSW